MKQQINKCMQYCLPHHLLSRFMGKLAACKIKWFKNLFISIFMKHYKVTLENARLQNINDYENFNAFFTRQLLAEARPFAALPDLISPIDGSISAMGKIDDNKIFQAKGINYSLESLLANDHSLVANFKQGHFATLYLAPSNYHRVHMPIDGKLIQMIHVPGRLFSVNQLNARTIPGLFARNERAICVFDTEIGKMAIILVGAMIVASIHTAWAGKLNPPRAKTIKSISYEEDKIHLKRGDEMGFFDMGSTAILLFQNQAVSWATHLAEGDNILLGQSLANTHLSVKD